MQCHLFHRYKQAKVFKFRSRS